MNCNDFNRMLQESVETRAPFEGSGLLEHASQCAPCRTLWSRHTALERVIADWSRDVPDVDLADRVLAKLSFDSTHERVDAAPAPPVDIRWRAPTRSQQRLATAAAAVLVASVSAVALLLLPSSPRNRVAVSPPDSVPQISGPADTAIAAAIPERGDAEVADQVEPSAMVREAGSAYWMLASRTATTVSDGVALVSPVDFSAAAGSAEADAEDPPTWIDGLGQNLAPLRSDFSRAIDVLLETVPDDTSAL